MATVIDLEDPGTLRDDDLEEESFVPPDDPDEEHPPMSIDASVIATEIVVNLGVANRATRCGRQVVEVLFHLPPPVNRNRRPDVAFVTHARWAADLPIPRGRNAWDVVPDLAVEVVSPNDFAQELMTKIAEYFSVGVRLVWVVYPNEKIIHVYESFTTIRCLTERDELTAGDVLPHFRVPVGSLFPITADVSLPDVEPSANS